jgi:ABC-2 type transport system permease protein
MAGPLALEYDSAQVRSTIFSEVRAVYRYRDFLKLLISKTLKSRYKRSVLGVAWTLLNPLVTMVVMSVAFSTLFHGAIPRYPVYLLIGLTVWSFFSQSTAFAISQLFGGGDLMRRVYLPPTIFAVASIANGLVNFGFALVPLVLIMLAFGHPFHASWWFFPVAVLILAAFALGLALLVSSFAAVYVDTVEMYQLALQAWFYLTPIMYPKEILDSRFSWALTLNPMHYMVEMIRGPIYDGRLPDPATVAVATALAFGTLVLGSWAFTRRADELVYRI